MQGGRLAHRWTSHPQARSTLQAIQLVTKLQPTNILWENVLGLTLPDKNRDIRPLDVVKQEVCKAGYRSLHTTLCPSTVGYPFVRFQGLVAPEKPEQNMNGNSLRGSRHFLETHGDCSKTGMNFFQGSWGRKSLNPFQTVLASSHPLRLPSEIISDILTMVSANLWQPVAGR